jgi:hypothetical protein
MAKLKEKSYSTNVWKVTGPKSGPLKYNGQFKAMTGKINGHERRDDGMIISLSFLEIFKMKNVITNRKITQRFAINYDDIAETEVSNWDGKTATVSSKKIVIA